MEILASHKIHVLNKVVFLTQKEGRCLNGMDRNIDRLQLKLNLPPPTIGQWAEGWVNNTTNEASVPNLINTESARLFRGWQKKCQVRSKKNINCVLQKWSALVPEKQVNSEELLSVLRVLHWKKVRKFGGGQSDDSNLQLSGTCMAQDKIHFLMP